MQDVYNSYIKRCLEAYNKSIPVYPCTTPPCGELNCTQEFCQDRLDCQKCLDKIFREPEYRKLRYSCKPITYYYVLRYLNRYASELNFIFNHFSFWSNFNHKNIVSVGCGPASELVGFESVFKLRAQPSDTCNFYGFDMNLFWHDDQAIIKNIIDNSSCNIFVNFSDKQVTADMPIIKETNVLVLNYVLSDIYKHCNKEGADVVDSICDLEVEEYLEKYIGPMLSVMPKASYVIINDTNSHNMGRNGIEMWVDSLKDFIIHKEVFEYPRRYISSYSEQKFNNNCDVIPRQPLLFKTEEDISAFSDNMNECRSAFVIIKKN